jgi:5-methylcytosine-specific restriction endonuclease McrA
VKGSEDMPRKTKQAKEKRVSWARLFGQLQEKPKKHKEPPMKVRDAVKARDHNRCQVCGREETSLHHIIFRSHSGRNDIENLVCLCTEHHTGMEGPHRSIEWRHYWEEWQREHYPNYLNEVRERA